MTRLHRYIVREILPPLVVGSVLLGLVLILSGRFDLLAFVLSGGVGPLRALKIFGCLFPSVLAMTVPIAFMLALLMAYGRLSEEQEISAMRAGGFRFWDLLVPGLVMASMVSAFLWVLNARIVPGGGRVQENVLLQIINERTFMDFFPEGRFESRFGKDLLLRVKRVNQEEHRLQGVLVFKMDRSQDKQINSIITAPAADVSFDAEKLEMYLTLQDASVHRMGGEQADVPESASYTLAQFESCRLELPVRSWVLSRLRDSRAYSLGRMTNSDVRKAIAEVRARPQQDEETTALLGRLRQGLASRHATALAPFALALVGVPVGMAMRTGKKSFAFVTALLILGVYIGLFAIAKAIVEGQVENPALYLQAPNVIVGLTGAVACWISSRA